MIWQRAQGVVVRGEGFLGGCSLEGAIPTYIEKARSFEEAGVFLRSLPPSLLEAAGGSELVWAAGNRSGGGG
eukprot:5585537-Pyramimonas_sp.AAC.1